jgi:hypothetical protein
MNRSLLVFAAGIALLTSRAEGQESPTDLLNRAIARAGGRAALTANSILEWRAGATIHVPGRTIKIAGEWEIRPDSAVSATWPVDQPGAPRRLIITGRGAWMQRGNAEPTPAPPEFHIEERHQFYLYQLLRLVTLLEPEFTVHSAPPDSLGRAALRVTHAGHPDVSIYFDPEGRVVALQTVFAARNGSTPESQEIHFAGEIESRGVRWFSEMRIFRAGKPYFDMTISDFRASARK